MVRIHFHLPEGFCAFGGHIFPFPPGKRRVVDAEDHRNRRFINTNARQDFGFLRRRDRIANIDALEEHLFDALAIDRLLGFLGEALAVGGLVVDDGDLLALEVLEDVLAGDLALLIVAPATQQTSMGRSRSSAASARLTAAWAATLRRASKVRERRSSADSSVASRRNAPR